MTDHYGHNLDLWVNNEKPEQERLVTLSRRAITEAHAWVMDDYDARASRLQAVAVQTAATMLRDEVRERLHAVIDNAQGSYDETAEGILREIITYAITDEAATEAIAAAVRDVMDGNYDD